MSREIRYVPARWKHPHHIAKRQQGDKMVYRPMYQKDFQEAYDEWQRELADWYEGYKLWHEKGLYKGYDDKIEPAAKVVEEQKQYLIEKGYDAWHQEEIALMDTGEYGYEQYCGAPPSPPSPNDYMPRGKWVQLFEEVSEGTPLSPPFKTKEQLVEWLATHEDFWGHTWTREQAEAMVKDEWAPSMVMAGGKIYTAEESVLLDREEKKD